MKFNTEKFTTTRFKYRVESIPVHRLSAFFEDLKDGETPEWKVRGLTGEESAIARNSVQENQNIEAVLNAVGSRLGRDIEAGIKELAGFSGGEKVPDDLVQRYSWLCQGSVDPVCDHDLAKKLALNFPEYFYLLTNKIIQLTGQGRVGELSGSGGSQE